MLLVKNVISVKTALLDYLHLFQAAARNVSVLVDLLIALKLDLLGDKLD